MIDKEEILINLDRSTKRLITVFQGVENDNFYWKPNVTSWSVAEIGEHLILIETLIVQLITKATRPTIKREPTEKVKYIQSTFLDHNKKLSAAKPIQPKHQITKKEEVISKLKGNRNFLINFIPSNDLSLTCEAYEHHLFGTLTRVEWIYFVIYHGERHLQQINRILKHLSVEAKK